jgi:DNA-binding transcriptional regulator YiaG
MAEIPSARSIASSSALFDMDKDMSAILDSFSDIASISNRTMQNMSIHQVIKAGRKRLKMTHQQFADALGVTRTAVFQWEQEDGTAPSRKHQPAVAKLLGISVAELMSNGLQNHEFIANYKAIRTTRDGQSATHTIPSLEDACNTLARCFEGLPKEDMDNAARWLSGLVYQPSSAPHVIGVLMEMVVNPRKSPPEKSTGT